jgi:hypothetical protein
MLKRHAQADDLSEVGKNARECDGCVECSVVSLQKETHMLKRHARADNISEVGKNARECDGCVERSVVSSQKETHMREQMIYPKSVKMQENVMDV